jgi:hypothetical protein
MAERPRNAFLLGLRSATFDEVKDHLRPIDLSFSRNVQTEDVRADWVYFPESCLLSLISHSAAGDSVETAMAGNEGAAGLVEACAGQLSGTEVKVQVQGRAWRMLASTCRSLASSVPDFSDCAWRLAVLQMEETRQSTICHALHRANARLARWLLETGERCGGQQRIPMTQEILAALLGVQRTTVTRFAAELQSQGLIKINRGAIDLINMRGLAGAACECRRLGLERRKRLNLEPITLQVAA